MTESTKTFEYHSGNLPTEEMYRPDVEFDYRVPLRSKSSYLNDNYFRLYGRTRLNDTLNRYLLKTNSTKHEVYSACYKNCRVSRRTVLISADNRVCQESFHAPILESDATLHRNEPNVNTVHGPAFVRIADSSSAHLAEFNKITVPTLHNESKEYDGAAIYLDSPWPHIHAHWILDVLVRAWPVMHAKARWNEAPLVVRAFKPYQVESLEMLGISRDRLFLLDQGETWHRFRELIVPSRLSSMYDCLAPEAMEVIDHLKRVAPSRSSYGRRIYVGRMNAPSRNLVNEGDVVEFFEGLGFVSVDTSRMSFADEVALFANADIIAGPYGSGMLNSIFMPLGTRVFTFGFESFIQNAAALRYIGYYLQQQLGCYIGGEVVDPTEGNGSDWRVDLARLKNAVWDFLF